jgi:hypothetical protein
VVINGTVALYFRVRKQFRVDDAANPFMRALRIKPDQ